MVQHNKNLTCFSISSISLTTIWKKFSLTQRTCYTEHFIRPLCIVFHRHFKLLIAAAVEEGFRAHRTKDLLFPKTLSKLKKGVQVPDFLLSHALLLIIWSTVRSTLYNNLLSWLIASWLYC